MQQHPQTLVADQAGFHYAMCAFREGDWVGTLQSLGWLVDNYPDSRRMAEVRYHMGLCHLNAGDAGPARRQFAITQNEFPTTVWSRLAGERLKELSVP